MDEVIEDGGDGETLHGRILRAAAALLEDSRGGGGGDVRLRERLRELKAQRAVMKEAAQGGAGQEAATPDPSAAEAGPLDAAA